MFNTLSHHSKAWSRTRQTSPLTTTLRKFGSTETGSATIEYVLWLPFFLMFTLFVVDASVTLQQHARVWDTARYTARLVATGDASESAAIRYAKDKLSGSYNVSIDTETDSNLVIVSIVGVGGLSISTPLDLLGDPKLAATYTMRNESLS